MPKSVIVALLALSLSALPLTASAQTPPPEGPNAQPIGQMPGPVPEEQPVPADQAKKKKGSEQKQGNEVGWGGQQKTDQEQKVDPARNEAPGQPPR
jgi:hypothetical protein